jgi:hypothetical protein
VSLAWLSEGTLHAQEPAPAAARRYQDNIANEDWSFLADPAKRTDRFDPIKYIALDRDGWFMTLAGEGRFRPESLRIDGGASQPDLVDRYLLQRYLFAVSIQLGPRVRTYVELQSGIINGKLGTPRPTDADLGDLHQAFVELRSARRSRRPWSTRIGRQELTVGSSRLIAASQGLNVKRSFDGVSGSYSTAAWSIDGGLARLVKASPGLFDDAWDPEQTFWGVSVTRPGFPWPTGRVAVYYLGIDRVNSIFVQGAAPERRHTVGSRLAGTWERFDYNYDLIGQWGRFGAGPIGAWALATENGYRFPQRRFRPRISVRANAASGDADPTDNRLGSFNPLFPGNTYSGLVGLFGPINLTDVTPSVQLVLSPRVAMVVESPAYWRMSTGDGLYAIDQRILIDGRQSSDRFVGVNPGVIFNWAVTPHASVSGAVTKFRSGAFLEKTFVGNGFLFTSIALTYRF